METTELKSYASSKNLAWAVAKLIAASREAACDADFIWNLGTELQKHGLQLEAEQRGVRGTYIRLAECQRRRPRKVNVPS